MSRRLVSAEQRLLRSLAQPPLVTISPARSVLHNYQVHVVPAWLVERSRLCKSFAVFTGQPTDSATVVVLSIQTAAREPPAANADADAAAAARQRELAESLPLPLQRLFAEYQASGLEPRETPLGTIMTAAPTLASVLVPTGVIEDALPAIVLKANLAAFGLLDESDTIDCSPPNEATRRLAHGKLGTTRDLAPIEEIMPILVRLLHQTLYFFDAFDLQDSDGIVCNDTIAALELFYFEFGPHSPDIRFDETSLLPRWRDPAMFQAVLDKLVEARNRLVALGFPPPKGIPSTDPNALRKQIKHFQRANNLEPTMVLDAKTLARMDTAGTFRRRGVATLGGAVMSSLRSKFEDITGLHGLTGGRAGGPKEDEEHDPETAAMPAPRRSLVELVKMVLEDKSMASLREIRTTDSNVAPRMARTHSASNSAGVSGSAASQTLNAIQAQKSQLQVPLAVSQSLGTSAHALAAAATAQMLLQSGGHSPSSSAAPLPPGALAQTRSSGDAARDGALHVPSLGRERTPSPRAGPADAGKPARAVPQLSLPPSDALAASAATAAAAADTSAESSQPRGAAGSAASGSAVASGTVAGVPALIGDTIQGIQNTIVRPTSRTINNMVKRSKAATQKGIERLARTVSNNNLARAVGSVLSDVVPSESDADLTDQELELDLLVEQDPAIMHVQWLMQQAEQAARNRAALLRRAHSPYVLRRSESLPNLAPSPPPPPSSLSSPLGHAAVVGTAALGAAAPEPRVAHLEQDADVLRRRIARRERLQMHVHPSMRPPSFRVSRRASFGGFMPRQSLMDALWCGVAPDGIDALSHAAATMGNSVVVGSGGGSGQGAAGHGDDASFGARDSLLLSSTHTGSTRLHPQIASLLRDLGEHEARLRDAAAALDALCDSEQDMLDGFQILHERLAERTAIVAQIDDAVLALARHQEAWDRLVTASEHDCQRVSYALGVLAEHFAELDVEVRKFGDSVNRAEQRVAESLLELLR
ncbi:hypothetical protein HK105_200276 [Polyrhizophydium stewartii]|uniref:Peptidoglycan binding-like domain-containing protein n=1 Tax=Polyrhizophydium stewartii TaxID=2732419 RepID=A0ABR4NL00_9FUNG